MRMEALVQDMSMITLVPVPPDTLATYVKVRVRSDSSKSSSYMVQE